VFNNKEKFMEDFTQTLAAKFGKSVTDATAFEKYFVLASLARGYARKNKVSGANFVNKRKVYYFSMEFLMGRMLTNNLMNLGIYDFCKEGLNELGIDINELEDCEDDQGLGNGGLGRLAACFIDSIASLGYQGYGNTIRYKYGFFRQRFNDGYQVEHPDPWLKYDNAWEVRKSNSAVEVPFWGHVESYEENGKVKFRHVNAEYVTAVPYDMPMIGADNNVVNRLRMWKAEASENYPTNKEFFQYESETRAISSQLYPDDTTREGKILRLKQQYFFSFAGLSWAIRKHLENNVSLDNFHELNVLQINDTHPAILVGELMRVLIDDHHYGWNEAWEITTKSLAYTNHTILAEALEKWPVDIIQPLLPRVYKIIEEINLRWCNRVLDASNDPEKVYRMAIIKDNQVHMAHLAIVGSFSVNGVAALHTEILKETTMVEWHNFFPGKFNNKTNGVTHRRWFKYCNKDLSDLVTSKIGTAWHKNPQAEFEKLLKFVEEEDFRADVYKAKQIRKQDLADVIEAREGVKLDVNSIFDIQIKRLHAYKRQLLNALHIMYLYNRLSTDTDFYNEFHPQTFIFGAKSAPGYIFAKKVIKLINSLSTIINNDEKINQKLKVVFVEDYNITYAEYLMPAADVSEQISLATKEASGTGNMKFMMNGALTIGTLDGANVEIHELVGDENISIFGLTKEEVNELQARDDYNPSLYIHNDMRLQLIVNQLVNGFFSRVNVPHDEFRMIYDELMFNDEYYLMKDFDSYVNAQEKINNWYKDRDAWNKACIVNIAKSGFFSSDRTIEDYVTDIWKLEKKVK